MGKPVPLRPDFDASSLRRLARQSKDAGQARRLLSLAAIYDGASRSEAARIGTVRCRSYGTGWCGSTPPDQTV
jgi:hypothetical protein